MVVTVTQPYSTNPDQKVNRKANGALLFFWIVREGLPHLPANHAADLGRLCDRILAAINLQAENMGVQRRRAWEGLHPPGQDMRNP